VVTSSISRPDSLAQSFRGAHRSRVCVRECVHRDECMRVYISTCVYTVFLKNEFLVMIKTSSTVYDFLFEREKE
jgi:hypothetical protein